MNAISIQPATYVYGVALAEPFGTGGPQLRAPGIGGQSAVRTIVLGDLAALVSDLPGIDIDLRRENLLDHQRVLDEALRRSDVLPFSFGTVAGSDEEVRDLLLRDGYDALRDQMEYIRGRIELQVKVFWEQERLFAEIAHENEEIRAMRDMISELPDDLAAAEKITLGQLTEAEIEAKSEWEADGVLDILEQHAVDILVSANMGDTMLLNAAFLVERDQEEEFDGAVYGLGAAQAGRLIFNYVGPLPPYSFINLAFGAEG
jgi:hypothetical protein